MKKKINHFTRKNKNKNYFIVFVYSSSFISRFSLYFHNYFTETDSPYLVSSKKTKKKLINRFFFLYNIL